MRSMKKIFIGILFLMILCLSPLGREQGYAATETADGYLGLKAEYTSLEKGSTVKLKVCIYKEDLGALDNLLEYDKSVFEQLTEEDFEGAEQTVDGKKIIFDSIVYDNSDYESFILLWNDEDGLPKDNVIVTINFTLKKSIDYTEISMYDIYGAFGEKEQYEGYHVEDKVTCQIENNNLKIASGTSKGSYGENIEVPLKLVKNVGGFSVLGLDVSYDPTVLEYQDTIIDDKYKSVLELKSVYNDVDNKTIKIALVGARDITDTGNFAKIVFKVKESSDNQVVKTTNIRLKATQVTNVSGVSVSTTTIGSAISIGVALNVGDVNGDNAINLLDALWILQYYNGVRTFDDSAFKRADVNNSNKVDLVDALMIMKYYNGEIKSFSSR